MTKLIHSIPWTLALTLAAQAGESEAIRIPETSTGSAQESTLDPSASASASRGRTAEGSGDFAQDASADLSSDVSGDMTPLPV